MLNFLAQKDGTGLCKAVIPIHPSPFSSFRFIESCHFLCSSRHVVDFQLFKHGILWRQRPAVRLSRTLRTFFIDVIQAVPYGNSWLGFICYLSSLFLSSFAAQKAYSRKTNDNITYTSQARFFFLERLSTK